MLSNLEFVVQSLELNLFFMRIAKEHSIFMEAAFMGKNQDWIRQADAFKNLFSNLLMEAVSLSRGIISTDVATSGELTTDLTLKAEAETEYYSGIRIDSNITRHEEELQSEKPKGINPMLIQQVALLNNKALAATSQLANFKAALLQEVLNCRIFTMNYPLLIDHILREARFYLRLLNRIQGRNEFGIVQEAVFQECFWNRIMAEHAKFIRGFLDPTEVKLFDTASDFGKRFDELTAEACRLSQDMNLLPKVTQSSLDTTKGIRDFKKQGTEGLVNCKIRSITLPLLGDHVLREANHYIRLLKEYKNLH